MAIFRREPSGGVKCTWGRLGTNHNCGWIGGYQSITAGCEHNKCDNLPCSLSYRWACISESIFITACSLHDHDEENRICLYTECKSEAELALEVLYYWSYWQTRSIVQPLCDSRATCIENMEESYSVKVSGRCLEAVHDGKFLNLTSVMRPDQCLSWLIPIQS